MRKFAFVWLNKHIKFMNVSANIAAMHAASFSYGISAHNMANASTDGFPAQEVSLSQGIDGGPRPVVEQSLRGTDIVTEMTRQQRLIYDYQANAQVVKMHDTMVGNVIDLLA